MDRVKLPIQGRSEKDLLDELDGFAAEDPAYKEGRTWSLVYYLGEDHASLLQEAYNKYASTNGLNPTAFKSLKLFENEVIAMTADLLNGPESACGVMTSGGTESCLLAVKTYRDYARARKRVKRPEMILPVTAHVAWHKGAEYFGVKVRPAPVDDNFRLDVKAVAKLVNRNTVMILASAPEYPHGMIDPVEELGALAQQKDTPLHVDACVGGYLLPFIEKLGHELPPWDFRVPGVTSISADTHKYGFAAKGASTITYRSIELMKYQMFVMADWTGGVFASPALLGTRPGGAYAAAWAAMQSIGEDGYMKLAETTLSTTRSLIDGINAINGLEVMGNPLAALFSYRSTSKEVNILAVGDQMEERGWHIDRLQHPEGLHAMVTPNHEKCYAQYLADLEESVDHVRRHPELAETGAAATYGMIAHLPFKNMVKSQVLELFSAMYAPGGKVLDVSDTTAPGDASEDAGAPTGLPPWLTKIVSRYVRWKSN